MRDVIDWDGQFYLGQIPEVAHTYNVIGNSNEWGLVIGETTFGGLAALHEQPGALIDYGSLIYITLQRAKTAREAIDTMASLVATYGYASGGESFSIQDPNEVWLLEMIGKGSGEKGAVWVARRVPEGYICAHANQARIQTFPLNDPENCKYSADVVDFARRKGFYPASAPAAEFSFSDVYNPVTFETARGCEARVWTFFRQYAPGMDAYLDYAKGYNLTNRMPLWVKPAKKLTLLDVMQSFRDHYEGTYFDMTTDVGGEAYGNPYRWRPLRWELDGKNYLHERAIGTQQTGWSFISQSRSWLPAPLAALFWFGVDDTGMTVWTPFYGSATRVPWSFDSANGDIMTMSFDSAFWVFNMVANFAYARYSLMYPEISDKILDFERRFINATATIDAQATKLYNKDPVAAVEYVTAFGVQTGNGLVADWLKFYKFLFAKYMDGNVKTKVAGKPLPSVSFPGYSKEWLRRLIRETGDRYLIPKDRAPTPAQVQHF